MDVNARGALATIAAVIPAMLERNRGRIIHVTASAGHKGAARMGVYSGTKAAVLRIVESLAEEYRDTGITANCVLPGTIDTPRNRTRIPEALRLDLWSTRGFRRISAGAWPRLPEGMNQSSCRLGKIPNMSWLSIMGIRCLPAAMALFCSTARHKETHGSNRRILPEGPGP